MSLEPVMMQVSFVYFVRFLATLTQNQMNVLYVRIAYHLTSYFVSPNA